MQEKSFNTTGSPSAYAESIEDANEWIESMREKKYLTIDGLINSNSHLEILNIVLVLETCPRYEELLGKIAKVCHNYSTDNSIEYAWLIHDAINTDANEKTYVVFGDLNMEFSLLGTIEDFTKQFEVSTFEFSPIPFKTLIKDYSLFIRTELSERVLSDEDFDVKPITKVIVLE